MWLSKENIDFYFKINSNFLSWDECSRGKIYVTEDQTIYKTKWLTNKYTTFFKTKFLQY